MIDVRGLAASLKAAAATLILLGLGALLGAEDNPWKNLGPRDGLNAAVILEVHRDRHGFVWIGSQYSLARYDGREFRYYLHDPGDPGSLGAGQVYSINEDSAGRFLIGMDSGLCRFDPRTDSFETFIPSGDPSKREVVYTALEDRKGQTWVSTQKAIYRVSLGEKGGRFTPIRVHERVSRYFQQMYPLLESGDGSLLAGSPDGLFRIDGDSGGVEELRLPETLAGEEVVSLVRDGDDGLLIGTPSKGLFRLDAAGGSARELDDAPVLDALGATKAVVCLCRGESGEVWVGGGGGFARLSPAPDPAGKRSRFYPSNAAESGDCPVRGRVTAIGEDASGNVWVGHDLGVSWSRVKALPFKRALASLSVADFVELSPDEILLVGGKEPHLWRRSKGTFEPLAKRPEYAWLSRLRDNAVEALVGPDGDLWIGVGGFSGDGVYRYDSRSGELLHFFKEGTGRRRLPDNLVFELRLDSRGGVWAGTGAGLVRFDEGLGGFAQPPFSGEAAAELGRLPIWRIEDDGKGRLWVGTERGLFRYDPVSGRADRYAADSVRGKAFPDDWILDLLLNPDGSLWAGTGYGGVFLFHPEQGVLESYGARQGLPSNMILSMARGEGGDIWMGTAFGLARLLGDGRKIKVYNVKDGISSNDFLGTSACLRSSDGVLMFGTSEGFFWFRPGEVDADTRDAPARIVRMASQDGKVALENAYVAQRAELPWPSSAFSVHFTSIDNSPGSETRFSYRLLGFDKDWVDSGYDRSAHYSGIPGGSYVFEARATGSSGEWSGEGAWARLPIKVGTHPLKTYWALGLYAAAAAGGLASAFLSYRRRQARKLAEVEAEARRERAASERLARLDQLKDAFLANTSHELRTPLHGIVGIAESLEEGAAGELPGEAKENLSMIASSGRRLASLVDDILDFSRLKQRDIVLSPRAVDLRSLIELVMRLSRPLVSGKPVELRNEVPADLPPVLADPARLQQIAHNLVGNAAKFTAAGSVTAAARQDGELLRLSISDTGIGIPADRISSVFESFEQVDATVAREYGGTGLGLTITRRLVELMGGSIEAESVPGSGSTFTVSLPAARGRPEELLPQVSRPADIERAAAGQGAEAGLAVPAGGAGTGGAGTGGAGTGGADPKSLVADEALVLVVDDEPINLRVLANVLSLRRYQVVQARSGEEALGLVEIRRPDLILLDVMMPRLNGYEVCERLRTRYPASEMPVIMLTARNQVADLVQGLESGANDYLAKPFSSDELVARIRTHLDLARINISLSRFVPREFLEILEKRSVVELRLGDQVQRDMSVMFCDIRDFTTLSEGMSPAETFAFVNEYLSCVVPVLRAHGGIIDKFIGDAVMALFPSSPDAALRGAIGAVKAVRGLSLERAARGLKPVGVGIGVHTGTLILGTVGEAGRMQETVISDAVNLASRVEGLTKTFGCSILVSQDSRDRLSEPGQFSLRFLGKVAVKGRKDATRVHEVMDPEIEGGKIARVGDFEKALEAYYMRSFDEAVGLFSSLARENRQDKASALYLQRSASLIAAPPGADWDGVERPETK